MNTIVKNDEGDGLKQACIACAFVQARATGPGALGVCRRNPPTMIYRNGTGVEEMGYWPVIRMNEDWCGWFKNMSKYTDQNIAVNTEVVTSRGDKKPGDNR